MEVSGQPAERGRYRDWLQLKNDKNAVFLDVTRCGRCRNRRFGGPYHLNHPGDKNRRARNNVSINNRSSVPPKLRFL
jgi:hypothetical protein